MKLRPCNPFVVCLWVAFVFLVSGRVASAAEVVEIEVFENSRTDDDTVIHLSGADKGDNVEAKDLEEIKKRLVSSGLFKDVKVYTQEVAGGVKLILEVKDKFPWAAAPTYYNQPTNKGVGLGYGHNNLFGQNKKLLIYSQVATGESFFVAGFMDPNVGNTRFSSQIDVYLSDARIFEFSSPVTYKANTFRVRRSRMRLLQTGLTFGTRLFGGVTIEARIRGGRVTYRKADLECEEELPGDCDFAADQLGIAVTDEVPEPGDEGWDVSGITDLSFSNLANWYGISSGTKLKLRYERALEALGSDWDYWLADAKLIQAFDALLLKKDNLVFRAKAGYGENLPFHQEFTAGGTGLRGYQGGQFRGNFLLTGNAEYSIQLLNIKGVALRGLVFYDTAYTAFVGDPTPGRNYLPDYDTDGISPFKNAVGGGVRLYIRQLVIPLLGLDWGYGLESGESEVYFAIGVTD